MQGVAKGKIDYGFLDCLRWMPPLKHKKFDGDFDIMDSDVAAYIANRPEIRQKMFSVAAHKKIIVYDKETGTWRGCEVFDG